MFGSCSSPLLLSRTALALLSPLSSNICQFTESIPSLLPPGLLLPRVATTPTQNHLPPPSPPRFSRLFLSIQHFSPPTSTTSTTLHIPQLLVRIIYHSPTYLSPPHSSSSRPAPALFQVSRIFQSSPNTRLSREKPPHLEPTLPCLPTSHPLLTHLPIFLRYRTHLVYLYPLHPSTRGFTWLQVGTQPNTALLGPTPEALAYTPNHPIPSPVIYLPTYPPPPPNQVRRGISSSGANNYTTLVFLSTHRSAPLPFASIWQTNNLQPIRNPVLDCLVGFLHIQISRPRPLPYNNLRLRCGAFLSLPPQHHLLLPRYRVSAILRTSSSLLTSITWGS